MEITGVYNCYISFLCLQNMRQMYEKCNLVHADLSAYNMLWHNDILYFIDVAQGVDTMHPHAKEFLLRDCSNVSEVNGIYHVPASLLMAITTVAG